MSTSAATTSLATPGAGCIPLRSWTRIRNHGDQISADLVRLMFGAEPVQVAAEQPHVLAVGSITFMANAQSTLWGCGVLNRQVGLQDLLPGNVRALRGRHSADVLVGHGTRLPDIPLGDPGIFAAELLRLQGLAPRRRSRIVVVPHHASSRHPAYAHIARIADVSVVGTLNNDWGLLQDIAGADVVISESLRGLIYAESFGKPSVWISGTEDPNWTFKFHDWFSTTWNPQTRPAPITADLPRVLRQAELRYSQIDKDALLAAFPHDQAIARPARLIRYGQCRELSPMTVFGDDSIAGALQALSAPHDDPAHDRAAAFDHIRFRVAQIFDAWAERPYVCVVDGRHTAIPTDAQKQVVAAELDRNADIDFAVLVDNAQLAGQDVQAVELGQAVRLYSGLRSFDGCLMLRPSLDPLGANHAVFGV